MQLVFEYFPYFYSLSLITPSLLWRESGERETEYIKEVVSFVNEIDTTQFWYFKDYTHPLFVLFICVIYFLIVSIG